MAKTPSSSDLTLRVESDGAVLYDRRTHAYTRPSAAQAFLLVASQEMPLGEAERALATNVGDSEAALAVGLLKSARLFNRRGVFPGRVLELPRVDGGYGAPLVTHLGLTVACNFACAHCYASSGKRAPEELTLTEVNDLVDQLAAIGCQKVVLGGGEPFLRKDLAGIIEHADRRGVDCFVHTNGSVLTARKLTTLARCPPAGLSVSVDGADRLTNDALRGKGTLARTLSGMARLREYYPPGFNISMTITPTNAHQAAALVELAWREGAGVLMFRPAYPAGEALFHAALHCDRETFARAIERARVRAAELGVTLDASHPLEQGVPDFDGFGCVAARIVMGIHPRGEVTPCLNLPASCNAGNVRDTALSQVWRTGEAFVAMRRQRPPAKCRRCRHYDICRGGCRVRALHAGHGLSGPDSWCYVEANNDVASARISPPARV